ncbi:MAG: CoB--CoM heterodisulfide reductase subunit C [Promethearchaeota archaeon]
MEKIQPNIIYSISNAITEEIIKDEALKVVRACFQCGTCTGSCPSGRRTAIRTRQIIRRIALGLDEVLSSDDIWLCSTCYTCYERCPRSIPVTDVIIKLRNLATQRGFMKPPHRAVTHILAETGHGVPLGTQKGGDDNNWSLLRASYGLPNIPPTTLSHPEAITDIQILMHATGFDELVGWAPDPQSPAALYRTKSQPNNSSSLEDTLENKPIERAAEKSVEKAAEKSVEKATKKSTKKKSSKKKKSTKKTTSKKKKTTKKKTTKKKSVKKTSSKKKKKTAKKKTPKKKSSKKAPSDTVDKPKKAKRRSKKD